MSDNRKKLAYTEGIVSVGTNLLLFVLKFWAGTVSGSIALIADAWHTLSDSLSSILVMLGAKLSSKKPDKKHPFGYGRWEQLSSIFIGFFLAIIAYDFIKESIQRLTSRTEADFGTIALVVTIVSILVKEALAQYAFHIARKTDNTSIKADGWHHRTDALSSVVVLAGILLKDYFWWIDSVLGIIIALMLFYAMYEILRESIERILGEKPSDGLIKRINKEINNIHPEELYTHHFHIHNYGVHRELTFHIKLDEKVNINEGHQIATKIEKHLRDKLNLESTIHIEPVNVKHD